MEGQLTVLRSAKSIVGTALLVLGTFILYENLAGAVGRLSHVLANGSEALGLLPAVVLAASQPVHAYAVDHHRFMLGLFQQVLASSWPLLLVIFGSVLSRDTFTDKSKHIQENTVDPPPPARRTHSADRDRREARSHT
jgi:presenilin-like A22 family membrane protease